MSVANRPVHGSLSPSPYIKRQLTTMLSILHRATGIAPAVGASTSRFG